LSYFNHLEVGVTILPQDEQENPDEQIINPQGTNFTLHTNTLDYPAILLALYVSSLLSKSPNECI
jgi:hypothetical protein